MDYEKAYKEAVSKIKSIIVDKKKQGLTNCLFEGDLNKIFPELAESEDERIRKAIHIYLDWLDGRKDYAPKGDYSIRDMLAWLEKQGDTNKTINRDAFAQNVLRGAAINLITWIDYNAAEGNMCLSNMECKDIEDSLVSGNWDKIYAYIKKKLEKQGEQKPTDKVEPKFKIGDVIKNINNGDTVKIEQILDNYYCYSGWDGTATIHSDFTISEQDNWELVEQKPAWSEEDERMYKAISIALSLNDAKGYLCSWYTTPEEADNWLKSLKDRVQPQQKQEWSEEDEEFISILIERINQLYVVSEKLCKYEDRDRLDPKHKDWLIEKIKSIKPQPHWKPTEEQMSCFKQAIDLFKMRVNDDVVLRYLNSLYNDLKKN